VRGLKDKLMVMLILLILSVPLYVGIVQVVNALGSDDVVLSFALRSVRKASVSNVFQVGDTLVAVAESGWADAYELTVYDKSSVVLVKRGEAVDGRVQAEVDLYPPLFNAGHIYALLLNAYVFDYPLPGTSFSESVRAVFEVTSTETRISVEAEYDGFTRGLHLYANLTDVEGFPIANEAVDFSLQSEDERRPNKGWIRLGSAVTDDSSVAKLNVAFGLPDGNYTVKASHAVDENFGPSEDAVEVEVFSNSTFGGFASNSRLGSGLTGSYSVVNSLGTLSLDVSNSTPYARLPTSANALYSVDVYLHKVIILFYLDSISPDTYIGGGDAEESGGPPYMFNVQLVWNPEVVGSHNLIGFVINCTSDAFIRFLLYGEFFASSEVSLNIQRCPTNLVTSLPETFYGDVFPVTVAFSMPRLYQAQTTDFYASSTLAPKMTYDGSEYVLDQPVSNSSVKLFVNGTLMPVNSTDMNGLVSFAFTSNLTAYKSVSLNITALVDDSTISYASSRVTRMISFTKARVFDSATAEGNGNLFNLNYTGDRVVEGEKLYIGLENQWRISAALFNQSVWNVPLSFLRAKQIGDYFETNGAGFATVPIGSNYLRVLFPNNIFLRGDIAGSATTPRAPPDGKVDYIDNFWFLKAYGSTQASPKWDTDADLNNDGRVNYRDVYLFLSDYGKCLLYLKFEPGGQIVYADSQGFVRVPQGAANFTVYISPSQVVQASLESFMIVFESSLSSNNLGEAFEEWTPTPTEYPNTYLVQVKVDPRYSWV